MLLAHFQFFLCHFAAESEMHDLTGESMGLRNPALPSFCSSHSRLSAIISDPNLTEQWLMGSNSKRLHHTWWGCCAVDIYPQKQFYGALPLMELQRLNPSRLFVRWSLQPCSVHIINAQHACFCPVAECMGLQFMLPFHKASSMMVYHKLTVARKVLISFTYTESSSSTPLPVKFLKLGFEITIINTAVFPGLFKWDDTQQAVGRG